MIIHSLYFQLCHQNLIFVVITAHVRSQRKEYSSEIHAHGIYQCVKFFLQPFRLLEISIMMRSSNYLANYKLFVEREIPLTC